MSEPSPNGLPVNQGPDGRFLAGHRLGRGNPAARAIELFRHQIIRELKIGRSVPRLVQKLKMIAFTGARSVRLRVKKPNATTGKEEMVRETVWMPVSDATQLAAIQELLSRGVGKSTQHKVVEQQDQRRTLMTLDQQAALLESLGAPLERWPVMVREHHRRKIEARVVEPGEQP